MMIIRRFLSWVEAAPAGERAEAAHALARAFLLSELTQEDHEIADAALTLLLDDPHAEVRAALADALHKSPAAPHHIIMALAEDKPDIAAKVLGASPLFMDAELVHWVQRGGRAHHMAIASRNIVPEMVAREICVHADEGACRVLLTNPGATFLADDLVLLAERLGGDATLRTALLALPALPAAARHILIEHHAEALKSLAQERGWLNQTAADRICTEATQKASTVVALKVDKQELPGFIEHLIARQQLTPAFLLRCLCSGNIPLFETCLAQLVGIQTKRMRSIVRSGNMAAFSAAYRKSSLPEGSFDVFAAALSVTCQWESLPLQHEVKQLPRRIMEEIVARCNGRTQDQALDGSLKLLRQLSADAARDSAREYALQVTLAARAS